ncbi:TetR/AcrR family transcriptional regulator [Nonomuraea sp. C10]|uniref:TetR/AcrR family transcriptional regulator n=1 Tax=Nonomuraea sp. C10 TaxID=2600577 RepID=UPI0011CE0DE4|nr:TetR/AcrR family transcriptional regulator [Nonomuraea sp. C10]TXK41039.1 TetR/AcrR family transcriptional regulator [Nonomuraea sp. C10]
MELPPVVARMWGREPVPRRGPKPRLDLARIVAACIEIADAEGLGGVSMATVASRVGVATMALYRYVGSKAELLTIMADSAAPDPPERDGLPWRDYLGLWARANRDFLLARPWLLSVDRSVPPAGPRAMLWLDRALAALGDAGLDAGERVRAATTLSGYAASDAMLTYAMRAPAPDGYDGLSGAADYGQMLDALLDPAVYPALSAAVREGAFRGAEGWTDDADFTFGLDLLLDGVEALVARRAR